MGSTNSSGGDTENRYLGPIPISEQDLQRNIDAYHKASADEKHEHRLWVYSKIDECKSDRTSDWPSLSAYMNCLERGARDLFGDYETNENTDCNGLPCSDITGLPVSYTKDFYYIHIDDLSDQQKDCDDEWEEEYNYDKYDQCEEYDDDYLSYQWEK